MRASSICIFAAVILPLVLPGCGSEQQPQEEIRNERSTNVVLSAESIKQIKLETEKITLRPFTTYQTIPAKVIPNQNQEALIGSLVQGRVHGVFVNIGDEVKAGQVLMTVEGLDVGQIKSGYVIAKSALDYAKANYDRQKILFNDKIGSQKSLLESQAEYEKAIAGFRAEDKKIHSVGLTETDIFGGKENEEHTSGTLQIKSSIDGIVVERNVVIGQYVDATTNAFKVMNTNSVWIDGQIYEKDLEKITRKTNAIFTTAAYPNDIFNGAIIYIGHVVDEQTRTITVRGDFGNSHGKLKPQMFGELKIPVSTNGKAMMVPEEAVIREAGLVYVFVQISDTAFMQRIVIPGITAENRIEIKEGLKEGDTIVSKGVFYLKSELKKEELGGD